MPARREVSGRKVNGVRRVTLAGRKENGMVSVCKIYLVNYSLLSPYIDFLPPLHTLSPPVFGHRIALKATHAPVRNPIVQAQPPPSTVYS